VARLAVFDTQALELQGAEELLDDPALAIPGNDLPSLGDAIDLVGGEQDPMNGLGPFRGMLLDDLDRIDLNAVGQVIFQRVLRPLERQRAEAQREMSCAGSTVGGAGATRLTAVATTGRRVSAMRTVPPLTRA